MAEEIFGHPASGRDLRAFMAGLERDPAEGIARVSREVSQDRELAAVVKLLEPIDHRAVWFEQVRDSSMPVAINLLGTKRRIAVALDLADSASPQVIDEFLKRLDTSVAPRVVSDGPIREVRDQEVDLRSLPIGIHSAADGGPYITSGVLLVRDWQSPAINAGIYRMMIKDERHLTISVDPYHDLGKVIAWGRRERRAVECAVVIGAHPALSIASQAKVPISRDAFEVMGSLMGEPVDVIKCQTVSLAVPVASEIVLEGRILPGETAPEGPFGEFHYHYGSDPEASVCEVTAITRRSDPIFVDLHPTHVEHRCLWLHPGREASLLRLLRQAVPSITVVHLPLAGAGMIALIALKKEHNGDSTRALVQALAADVFIKHAVVVDAEVDIYQPEEVALALAVRFQGDRDLVVVPQMRGYSEDPSTYRLNAEDDIGGLTTKLGYDATLPTGARAKRADDVADEFAGLDLRRYLANPSSKMRGDDSPTSSMRPMN